MSSSSGSHPQRFSELAYRRGSSSPTSTALTNTRGALVQKNSRQKRSHAPSLNARFDRMVETMRMSSRISHPKRRHQNRTRSKGDHKSATVNPFEQVLPSQLDTGISLIKADFSNTGRAMNTASHHPTPKVNTTLPAWLHDTLKTLEPDHPAKLLLPRSPSPAFPMPDQYCSPVAPSQLRSPQQIISDQKQLLVYRSPRLEPAIVFDVIESLIADANISPPFSTPGPGSTTVRPPDHTRLSEDFSTSLQHSGKPLSSFWGPSLLCEGSPSYAENAHSDDLLDLEPFCEPYTDESTSEPETKGVPAHILPLFLTPLPEDRGSSLMHSDSPTEEPFKTHLKIPNSHCDNIDFRWEPYDRKRDFLEQKLPSMHPIPFNHFDDFWRDDAEVEPLTKIDLPENSSLREGPLSAGIFRYGPPDLDNHKPQRAHTKFVDELEATNQIGHDVQKDKPIFAPAPGIYLSPLQSHGSSEVQLAPSPSHLEAPKENSVLLQLLDRIGPPPY